MHWRNSRSFRIIMIIKMYRRTATNQIQNARMNTLINVAFIAHCSLDTPKRVTGKQWRPRSVSQNVASDQSIHYLKIVQPFVSLYNMPGIPKIEIRNFQYIGWVSSFSYNRLNTRR